MRQEKWGSNVITFIHNCVRMWGVLICNFVAIVAAVVKLQARETRRAFVTSLLYYAKLWLMMMVYAKFNEQNKFVCLLFELKRQEKPMMRRDPTSVPTSIKSNDLSSLLVVRRIVSLTFFDCFYFITPWSLTAFCRCNLQ